MRWEEPGEGEEPGILGSTRRPGRAIPCEWVITMQTCLLSQDPALSFCPKSPWRKEASGSGRGSQEAPHCATYGRTANTGLYAPCSGLSCRPDGILPLLRREVAPLSLKASGDLRVCIGNFCGTDQMCLDTAVQVSMNR